MDFAAERERMVATQVERRGVRDTWVLEAMRIVPRETFLSAEMAEFAYEDSPLPIGQAQTISQPYIVAKMLEAAELGPGDRVLEVGTGSGYAAAVMAQICREVYSIERHASLAGLAGRHVEALGYTNIHIRTGDGTQGWPAAAPFDAIIVAAGMDGALPSVVAGLVPVPVIGLPVSVGYGIGGNGEAALHSMLQGCAPGLSVVNIDNGFGAAYQAATILQLVMEASTR